MAFLVAQRTREIGVRIALGAATGDVVWLVMKEVVVLSGIGIGIALAGAWARTRMVKTQLFCIEPNDPFTLVSPTPARPLVPLLARPLPARRASFVVSPFAPLWGSCTP